MINNFEVIENLYIEKKLFFDGNYLCSTDISKEQFSSLFPIEDYESQEFENGSGSVCCDDIDFVFEDVYRLIDNINKTDSDDLVKSPREIILKDCGPHRIGDFALNFKKWMQFFAKLANHQYKNTGQTYVFIEKTSFNTSTVLEIKIDDYDKDEIFNLINNISSPSLLLDSCLNEDAHQGERLSTMKTSLTNLINEKN